MTQDTATIVATDQHGSLELLDVARPAPTGSDVLVAIAAAAINPVDTYVRAGMAFGAGWTTEGHQGLGWDLAGTVIAVGPEATDPDLTPGRVVAGLSAGPGKPIGGQATHLALPASAVAPVPAGVDVVDAGSLTLNVLTADQALDLLGDPRGGLLITGAAGGVGGHAVPLAARRGWRVIGLARESDRTFVEGLGVRAITDLDDLGEDRVAAVLDAANLGGPAAQALVRGGSIVELVEGNTPQSEDYRIHSVKVQPDGPRLARLLALAAAGTLPIRVRARFPLVEADAAYRELQAGGRGAVVLLTA